MAQSWTANCFASGDIGQENLQEMENNFLALWSCFSGAAAPADTVAGMLWLDTGNHMLKQRNEADNAWLDVFDLVNGWAPKAQMAPEHGAAAVDMLVNVCYGTGAPPAANTTTEGALFFKYTA